MRECTIDLAGADDLARVRAIDPRVRDTPGRDTFLARAVAAGQCCLAREGAMVVGFAVFDRSLYDQPFVALLFVAPERRRQGVATALIRYIEAVCPTEKLFTSTNASNEAMQGLCERLGFARSGWIEHLDEGDPEIIYFKRVTR
ncbi:MAG TPA: GNAT family N-acetyltransferase [Dehalococcoidia bacterium]|nr:GNAT family N-acetyltransferase [Dehalococcoidia bacterium]